MKCIIVGAGIVGAACAMYLAERGVDVTIVDQHDPPGGSTARGEGMVILANKEPKDAVAAIEAIDAWRAALPSLGEIEFRPLRTILVALDDATQERLTSRAQELRDAGMSITEMTGDQCRREDPGLSPSIQYGIRADASAHIQPMLAAVALLQRAKSAGATVVPRTAIKAVEPARVHTEDGCLEADEIIVAAGAATGLLFEDSDFTVPIEPRRGHLLIAERRAANIVESGALGGGYMAAVQSKDSGLFVIPNIEKTASGTVLLGTSRERVGFDERINGATVARICATTSELYPGLADCRVIRSWVGFRPWTPDKEPLVGRLAPHLSIAAGHEGEGITYALLTARRVTSVILDGADNDGPWDPLRFTTVARRTDSSNMVISDG